MQREPFLEQWRNPVRKTKWDIAGRHRTRPSHSSNDGRHFVIRQPWNDRSNQGSNRHSGAGEGLNGSQAPRGLGRSRLQFPRKLSVKRGHRNEDQYCVKARQPCEQINIASNKFVLSDDHNRVAEFNQNFQALSR
jgi:hypothetical protein